MKGFFSTIIIIAILLILINLSILSFNLENNLSSLESDLIIVENASKERTIMENNIDRIIQQKLIEQVEKENFNLILIQTEINSSLLNYLGKRAKATNLFFEDELPLTLDYLMLNSSAFLLEIKGIKFAEYSYTSAPLMNTTISSKLGKDSILYFTIPIGYTIRVVQ